MARRKKRRVPQVLWRLYRNRARTLAETILSLLHSPPPVGPVDCRCGGWRCLGCCGDNAFSFLVRSDDGTDYRRLLNHSFVVVPDNSPPFSGFDHHNRWSQLEIVRRSIEMTLHEKPTTSNVIYSGYDKFKRFSAIVELLTTSAWEVLLKRVGDTLMLYLLRNTSIFLPLPQKSHHQVAGFPINDLCPRFSGFERKRKRTDEVYRIANKFQRSSSDVNLDSNSINSHIGSRLLREYDKWKRKQNALVVWCYRLFQKSLQKLKLIGEPCSIKRRNLHLYSQRISILPFSSKLYRILDSCDGCDKNWKEKDILNSLRPNSSSAKILFQNIFGSSDDLLSAQSMPCFHRQQCSLIKSTCRYHALIKHLKALIRKAKCCQHLRLLDKHCVISSLDQHTLGKPRTDVSIESFFEGSNSERNEGGKEYSGLSVACNVPPENLQGSGSSSCRKIPKASDHQFVASKSYCPKKQVVSFIWAACRSIVPQELLGSPHNWRVLRKNISSFICLRRFEKFSLNQCIHKLKVTDFALLSDKSPGCFERSKVSTSPERHRSGKPKESCTISDKNCERDKILQNWIFWLFSHLVVPLLQANFYITESEHGQEVYYYKKSIWEKLISETLTSLKARSYLQLNEASLSKIVIRRSFGFSRVRLCPKEKGFRVLANLKAPSKVLVKSPFKHQYSASSKISNSRNIRYASFKPVNKLLYDAHVVLKGIQVKKPDMLGSSVFDYNDVYRKFAPFLSLLKSSSSSMPDVFIVVADVSKAFDSVDQDKLLIILKDVISDDVYPLNQYLQVACRRKYIRVRNHLMVPSEDNFPGCLKGSSSSLICAPHSILVKQQSSKRIKKEELFLNLNEHIKFNVLQLGNGFFQQKVGIAQGSILSSLLCSFYYGHLERNMIYPFLNNVCDTPSGDFSGMRNYCGPSASGRVSDNELTCNSKYILLRLIDDFLFISTSRNQASLFQSLLQRGFGEYNCYMNKEKFGSNFGLDQIRSSRFYIGEDGISFLRWSGVLVNCSTLEIQADYTRYLNSHLSSCLTVNRHDKPGHVLRRKLCQYLRPKCHPLFYDSNINSCGVVRLNIYQAFLLCAMKFHCYSSSLNSISTFSQGFYMKAIEKSLSFMYTLIKKRMHSMRLGSQFRPIFEVTKSEIEWLGLTAYFRVLKRKNLRYVELLSILWSKMMKHGESKSTSAPLQYAVDDTHSSLFWKIKY